MQLKNETNRDGEIDMWIIAVGMAIAVTFINYYLFSAGKEYKLAMAFSLSFTALTLCAEYSLVSDWVEREDWSALWEVPNYERALWGSTIVSILLNISPVFVERKANGLLLHDTL